jgi:3-methylfumaryl-CoA hydratase
MTKSLPIDLDHLRQWIGKTEQASDTVSARLVRGLLATTASDNISEPVDGEEAPLAVHWCLAPPIAPVSQLGPDGHPARGDFLPPIPLPQRMWAGGRLEFYDHLRVGDAVTRRSVIRDVDAKEGRTGFLCFVTVGHEISTDRGLSLRERQDIVYRAATTSRSASAAAAAASRHARITAQWSRIVQGDPLLLFRYSALTFNGHRIHYDRAYAIDVEGYPGLVVQGPLQATLLLDLASSLKQARMPASFEFRGVKPLFDGSAFTVNADANDSSLRLWTANAEGETTMEARVTW